MDARVPRRILVTGATGFIGQAVIPALRARFPEAVLGGLARSERSAAALAAQHLTPVRGDLGDASGTLAAGVRGFAPDAIVHLAAEIASSRDTTAIQRTNVEGTRRLADITRELDGLRCFLYASTVVTGDAGGRVLTEDGPFPLETDYGRAKHEGERILAAARVPTVVVRPSHVYGPGGWFAHIVTDVRRGLFRVPGRGDNWWDVVHVDDVAAALALALTAPAGSAFHVVDDEPVPMIDFFREVARQCGKRGVGHAPLFLARLLRGKGAIAAAVRSARSSNARLKAELGWKPRYPDYRTGLAATFAALGRDAAA
jgi:nucleoside-diphosphate-sugar epimerase